MRCTLAVGLKRLAVLTLCATACLAGERELGGSFGYGFYRAGTIFAPGGRAEAAIRSRFTAGVVLGHDLYEYVSGEIRYVYQDGHPSLRAGPVKTDMQGQSHAITYDLLFHLKDRRRRLRPFFAAGAGVKG
jgi:hypothetical protein